METSFLKRIAILCIIVSSFMCCTQTSSIDNPKEEPIDNPKEEEVYPCNCIMDTLKGEWSWIKRYGGLHGTTMDNDYKSIVKILNQNEDASINYEIFVADTLFYSGSFQIQEDQWNILTANIKLPHRTPPMIESWRIFMGDMLEMKPSENTLCFMPDGLIDDYIYYYRKIE